MIEDISNYLSLCSKDMKEQDLILLLKTNGASQISRTKVLINVYGLCPKDADDLVQNSRHWIEYKEGNDYLKTVFFENK